MVDTYLIMNEEKMQVKRDKAKYPQAQYPHPRYQQNQYPQKQYSQPRGVEIPEDEDKEEDLVVEEAKLHVIIVGN